MGLGGWQSFQMYGAGGSDVFFVFDILEAFDNEGQYDTLRWRDTGRK